MADISSFTTQDHVLYQSEASSVGLAPGAWPIDLMLRDESKILVLQREMLISDPEGDVLYATYSSADGRLFKIYNT